MLDEIAFAFDPAIPRDGQREQCLIQDRYRIRYFDGME